MVLEISINGDPYVDIIDAGGIAESGGYERSSSPTLMAARSPAVRRGRVILRVTSIRASVCLHQLMASRSN